ncbi:MAG TPA: response regulator transcription factor [Terriglobia bacterium]|nr:response regulator transcription factor [Terriglobia bacterium]
MGTTILIVDDHEIVRQGVRNLINVSRPEWEISGEATNGVEAIEAVKALKPDVVILDITMPSMSGLEAASHIGKLGLGSRVLLFSMHESERLTAEARQAGAQGFVMKSQAARDLILAIDRVLAGGTFFGPSAPEVKPIPGEDTPPIAGAVFCLDLGFCGA